MFKTGQTIEFGPSAKVRFTAEVLDVEPADSDPNDLAGAHYRLLIVAKNGKPVNEYIVNLNDFLLASENAKLV